MKHKRPGVPPIEVVRQRSRYERLKAARPAMDLAFVENDIDLMPWLRSVSAQVIARRKLKRMVAR